jgi:hypothetical protein
MKYSVTYNAEYDCLMGVFAGTLDKSALKAYLAEIEQMTM